MEVFRSRWFRFPAFLLLGFAVAALTAWLFHPHYLPLCDRVNVRRGATCDPISLQSMIGLFIIGLGVITMLIVPIVVSIYQVVRHGHEWETPRGTETALTNLPILGGLIYLAAGAAVAITGY